ncbi:CsbD family protein [uncultured Sphingomonas sp.]|uniref:CsbD family protein n=1 Tax=uncultured Sphingomonas sp. TaxID=158754 RepID=UPI0026003E3F|nr:CsbD family protein [uncultured Sphingomonas sp.]
MNRHELHGSARHLGGKVENAAGDLTDRRNWQVGGVVNQVAGSAEHLFGRAQSIAGDAADMTPGLIEDAREQIGKAADHATTAARDGLRHADAAIRDGARQANAAVREHPRGSAMTLAAALGGLALGWLLFARRG